jgi:cytochrome c oxidase subunit 1
MSHRPTIFILILTAFIITYIGSYLVYNVELNIFRYHLLAAKIFRNSLQLFFNKSYISLDWALTSPPKPQAFISLPLNSLSAHSICVFF